MGEMEVDNTDLAFVLSVGREFSFERRKRPEPVLPKDVIVEVVATGLCGSDVSIENASAGQELIVDTDTLLASRRHWRLQSRESYRPRS